MFVLSLGGYTTGPKQLIQMLRQKSRPYLFSNTLPPAVVGGAIKVRCMVGYGQALRDALAAGREKKGELATTSLEFEFHLQFPCGSPSTELSDFRQSARSGNERECKQTLKNTCQG